MVSDPSWEPILDGALGEMARGAIRDIARGVANGEGIRRRPQDRTLFWAYIAGAIEEDWVTSCYDAATDELGSSIGEFHGYLGLHGGLAGTGWVVAHVSEEGVADELLVEIDALLMRTLDVDRREGDYDLIGWLVGFGVYLLERGDAPSAKAGLARVIGHLRTLRERTPQGAAWFTRSELLPAWQRETSPDGYFNCGLAHGIPGVVALLGRVVTEAGPDADNVETCREAMRWLTAQRLADDPAGRFPSAVHRGEPPHHAARTAWCYGDPGVALAGWGASARLGLDVEPWRQVAREVTNRAIELTGIRDAGLCHGAIGLAHILNRCYQASREPVFRDAARVWFEHALAMRRPDGIGGFMAWTSDGSSEGPTWAPAADLIEGAMGIGLALLAAVEPTEPRWDRLFQCDLPIADR